MVKIEGFLLVLGLAFTLYSFIDCAMREDHQVRNLPKWGWLLVILLFGLLGSLGYLFAGRNGARTIKAPKKKVLPPDDDPDFLNKI
jgi:hypothetical protein